MKLLITVFLILFFSCSLFCQSATLKRLELKRLEFENKYQGVGDFDSITGIAAVYNYPYMGYIDTTGKQILPLGSYQTFAFSDGIGVYNDIEHRTFRVINKSGKPVKEFRNISSLKTFKKGLAIFGDTTGGSEKYGVMNLQGKIIIESKYPYIEEISEKYYFVNSNKEGAGIINSLGDTVVPIKYGFVYIDTLKLQFIGWNNKGFAIFDFTENILKYLGKDIFIESTSIEGVPYQQRDNVIIVKDRWGSSTDVQFSLVNLNFDTIVPKGKYLYLSFGNEGFIRFSEAVKVKQLDKRVTRYQHTKIGFLNTKGEITIPAIFDYASYFTEGFCSVNKNNKWGYINHKGKVIIPLKFDKAYPFRNGFAKVKINDKFFIIDKSGKVVLNSKSY